MGKEAMTRLTGVLLFSLFVSILFFGFVIAAAGSDKSSGSLTADDSKNVVEDTGELYLILNPIDDTWVKSSAPNESKGDSLVLYVKEELGDNETEEDDIRKSLIKFDLSGLPEDVELNSAILRLYMHNGPSEDGEHFVNMLESDWDEDTVTWETKPEANEAATASASILSEDKDVWVEWDVSLDVMSFLAGENDNYGWQVMATGDVGLVGYKSSDNLEEEDLWPQLVIDYTQNDGNETDPDGNETEPEFYDIDDVVNTVLLWGDCEAGGECEAYDFNKDGMIDETDMNILRVLFGKDKGVSTDTALADTNGDGVIDIDDVVFDVLAWGECLDGVENGEGIECQGDIYLDGVIDEVDVALVSVLLGVDLEDAFVLSEPSGTLSSSTIPMSFDINVEGDFSCSYRVDDSSGTTVIDETALTDCAAESFELSTNGDYVFHLFIEDLEGSVLELSSDFTIDISAGDPNSGGGSSNSGSSGGGGGGRDVGGGDGGCLGEWVCEEWSECSADGTRTRVCEIMPVGCAVNVGVETPATSEACQLEQEVESQSLPQRFLSGITGAVIGPDGNVRATGVIMFLALIVAIYAFSAAWRSGYAAGTNNAKTTNGKTNGKTAAASTGTESMDKKGLSRFFLFFNFDSSKKTKRGRAKKRKIDKKMIFIGVTLIGVQVIFNAVMFFAFFR